MRVYSLAKDQLEAPLAPSIGSAVGSGSNVGGMARRRFSGGRWLMPLGTRGMPFFGSAYLGSGFISIEFV